MVRVVAAVLLLSLASVSARGQSPDTSEHSIMLNERYRLSQSLHRIPLLDSYHLTLENVAQPVIYQVEESGGFSDADPAKFSIYGDSWMWNRWYLDGIDITDPYSSGSGALVVPFGLIGSFELAYRETPGSTREQGVALVSQDSLPAGRFARVVIAAPQMGGKWPLARPLMNLISGKHAVDRAVAPPQERRRFVDNVELSLAEAVSLGEYDLQLGLQAQRGQRRFLDFRSDGRLKDTFDEAYAITSLGARLRPKNGAWTAWLIAEHRSREHMFAELYHARAETAALSKGTVFAGLLTPSLRFGLTFQQFELTPEEPNYVREAADLDGESLFPFFVDGRYRTLGLDISTQGHPAYAAASVKAVHATPNRTQWSTQTTWGGESYGRWDFEAKASTQIYGDARLGWADSLDLGQVRLRHDLYALGTYAVNQSHQNTLALFDLGARILVEPTHPGGTLRPFLSLARTPVSLSPELARLLDPDHLSATSSLKSGAVMETRGGGQINVQGLSPTDVYSAAAGLRWVLGPTLYLDTQGIFKAYRDTMRLDLDGDEASYGTRSDDGVFFWRDGETRYRLHNVADHTPVSFGLHLQLVWNNPGLRFLTVGFSAFNAVGRAPFGNGPNANDIGVVNFGGANPNSQVNDLANLDSDRGFSVKAVFGHKIWRSLWAQATVRFRDGTPFSFFDVHEQDGQYARTYHAKRGSPLKVGRPLDGPREDFHLNLDLQLRWQTEVLGQALTAFVLATNLIDMGNEIQEVSNNDGIAGRAALESQIPRALFIGLTLGDK